MGVNTNQIATIAEAYAVGQTGSYTPEAGRCCTYSQAVAYGIPVTASSKLITYDVIKSSVSVFYYLDVSLYGSYPGAWSAYASFSEVSLWTATWYTTEAAARTGTKIILGDTDNLILGTSQTYFGPSGHDLSLGWMYYNSRYVLTRVYCHGATYAVAPGNTDMYVTVPYTASSTEGVILIIKDVNTSKYTGLVVNAYHG